MERASSSHRLWQKARVSGDDLSSSSTGASGQVNTTGAARALRSATIAAAALRERDTVELAVPPLAREVVEVADGVAGKDARFAVVVGVLASAGLGEVVVVAADELAAAAAGAAAELCFRTAGDALLLLTGRILDSTFGGVVALELGLEDCLLLGAAAADERRVVAATTLATTGLGGPCLRSSTGAG